jgi:osmotically-inducible protein OsmY
MQEVLMAVATATKTDEEIQRDVLDELKWDARVQPNEIGVIVKDGVVTLTGWVDSFLKKWDAEEAAHKVSGVKAVVNEIEVRLAHERTDMDIAKEAVRALELNALVPVGKVEVTVSKGWLTLRGEVEWQYQKEEAERSVARIAGVKGVSNLITVKPKPSHFELQKKIEDALIRRAELDASRIKVEVQGNRVVLRGTVHSWAEREEAERTAWSAPGITVVENRITVDPVDVL